MGIISFLFFNRSIITNSFFFSINVFKEIIQRPVNFNVDIDGNTVDALTHQHPAVALAGIFLGVIVVISKNQHALGDDDVKGAELLRRTVVFSFAISAVLLIVKVVSLALALLDFPLVFNGALLVFTL